MILDLFIDKTGPHPLADAKERKRILAQVPVKDDLKSVDEVGGWLESIVNSDGFPLLALLEAIREFDEAGQPHLRRLTRHYLTARLAPAEEKRIWAIASHYWVAAADAYALLLAEYQLGLQAKEKPKGVSEVKALLPLIYVRLVAALAAQRKWRQFHYEEAPEGFWQRIGAVYLETEKAKSGAKPVQIYPLMPGGTTAVQEYLQAIVLEASSLDALKPAEMELADKLIAHFVPQFSLGQVNRPDNLYWIDPALDKPPLRLAKLPKATPTVRLIGFGQAPEALAALIRTVERGEVPADLMLGGQYPPRLVLKVLRHLASYWAPKPPLRQHHRHAVQGGLAVLRGFEACLGVVDSGSGDGLDFGETWTVENVSLGGMGASVAPRAPAAAIGDLLALQPGGGENWLLGVVRRFSRSSDGRAQIGVETVSRQATPISLRLRGGSGYVVGGGQAAALLDTPGEDDLVHVLVPAAFFDFKESYDSKFDGKSVLLTPVELVESGVDFQIGRYKLLYAD
jgi:hypothetical protein